MNWLILAVVLTTAIGGVFYRPYLVRLKERRRCLEENAHEVRHRLDEWMWSGAPEVAGDKTFARVKIKRESLFSFGQMVIALELSVENPRKMGKIRQISNDFCQEYDESREPGQCRLIVNIRPKARRRVSWRISLNSRQNLT